MTKQVLQSLRLDRGIEESLPGVGQVNRPRRPTKVMQVVRALAVYIRERRQLDVVESFISRKTHEDEARLEFERFLYW